MLMSEASHSHPSSSEPATQSIPRREKLLCGLGGSLLAAMGSVATLFLSEEGDWKAELKKHEAMREKIPALVAKVTRGSTEQMGQVLRIVSRESTWNEIGLRMDVASELSRQGLLSSNTTLLGNMYHDQNYPTKE